MILAIDTGNTHIEIGLYEGTEFLGSWRIATGVNRTEDELMAFVRFCLDNKSAGESDIEAIAMASVVPNITQIFTRLSAKYFGRQPFVVKHGLNLGLTVDYQPPEAVGADRLCNAVAAVEKYDSHCIVIDMGTATTFDVVHKDRIYLGGVIAPGLETASASLVSKASKLPTISLDFPQVAIGKSTEKSMQSGIMLGTLYMIEGIATAIRQELSGPVTIIATGGLSGLIGSKSKMIDAVEPNLVLDGLIRIYNLNK